MELLLYLAEFHDDETANEGELGVDPLEVDRMMQSDAAQTPAAPNTAKPSPRPDPSPATTPNRKRCPENPPSC